jgi:predicted ATPase
MITHLKVKGFKCIEEFDHDLKPFNVLIGPNDSGKSSVLDSLNILGQLVLKQFDQVFHDGYEFNNICWRGSDRRTISWDIVTEEKKNEERHYSLGVRSDGGLSAVLDSEKMALGNSLIWQWDVKPVPPGAGIGSRGVVLNSKGVMIWERDSDGMKNSLLNWRISGVNDSPAQVLFTQLVGSIRKYSLDATKLAAESIVPVASETPSLSEHGDGLPSVLADMKLRDYARFKQIEHALCEAVPGVREIVITPASKKQGPSPIAAYSLAFVRSDTSWTIPASQSSAGLLLLTGYLTLVHSKTPPKVLLVEEPENGVHPRRLELVVKLLRSLTEGLGGAPPIQVILTTHSPYLLDYAKADEVLMFNRDEHGAARASRLSDAPNLEERLKDQLLGEMWFNIGEEDLVPKQGA